MSFSDQLTAAIAAVRTYAQIDNLSRELWAAYAAGLIADDDAQAATELLHARRRSLRDDPRPPVRKAFAAPPKRRPPPRSPDRAKSLARRRACATSGEVPSKIACQFTQGETAALAVIAGECRERGACTLPIDAIAAIAGTSRSVVKRALGEAKALGLITVTERPRPGQKHLPNVVKIVSLEWRTWIDRGPKRDRLGNQRSNKGPATRGPAGKRLSERGSFERSPLRPDSPPPVERNDRLEAVLACFKANVRARAAR